MKNSIIQNKNAAVKGVGATLLSLLFWCAVWYAAACIVNKEILVAPPVGVLKRLYGLLNDSQFLKSALFSLLRVFGGFAAGVIFSIILSFLTFFSKIADALFQPLVQIIKSTPVASFNLLALVWLDRQILPVFIAFLIVLPIMWENITAGIKNAPKELIEVADVFGASEARKIFSVYIPSAVPFFLAGCKTCLGLAWKAGIAAEVLSPPDNSIGKLLYNSKIYYDTTGVFAYTIAIIVLSLAIEKLFFLLIRPLENRFT